MAEPPVTVQAIHDDGPGNLIPTRIVIHATCPRVGYPRASAAGLAASTARYFTSAAAGGSAHYIVDVSDEQHCARDSNICWHAPPNDRSIGIEICAEGGDYPQSYTRSQWLSPQVWPAVVRAAARTAELAARFGIPLIRMGPADLLTGHRGVCGHVDVSRAWHQSDHSDPGPAFPWPEFMAAATGKTPPSGKSWPLPKDHYYGVASNDTKSHSGHNVFDRPAIKLIQQALIRKGFVPGITNPDGGWADGIFEQPTADAVTAFQHAKMPGTTRFGQVWSDDWAVLLG